MTHQPVLPEGTTLQVPMFHALTIQNGGLLPNQIGAHACWYYARVANQAIKTYDDGATYEGERDHLNALNNLARSVATMYGLKDPGEFLLFMDYVKAMAMLRQYEWDERIEKPSLYRFIGIA